MSRYNYSKLSRAYTESYSDHPIYEACPSFKRKPKCEDQMGCKWSKNLGCINDVKPHRIQVSAHCCSQEKGDLCADYKGIPGNNCDQDYIQKLDPCSKINCNKCIIKPGDTTGKCNGGTKHSCSNDKDCKDFKCDNRFEPPVCTIPECICGGNGMCNSNATCDCDENWKGNSTCEVQSKQKYWVRKATPNGHICKDRPQACTEEEEKKGICTEHQNSCEFAVNRTANPCDEGWNLNAKRDQCNFYSCRKDGTPVPPLVDRRSWPDANKCPGSKCEHPGQYCPNVAPGSNNKCWRCSSLKKWVTVQCNTDKCPGSKCEYPGQYCRSNGSEWCCSSNLKWEKGKCKGNEQNADGMFKFKNGNCYRLGPKGNPNAKKYCSGSKFPGLKCSTRSNPGDMGEKWGGWDCHWDSLYYCNASVTDQSKNLNNYYYPHWVPHWSYWGKGRRNNATYDMGVYNYPS